MEGEGGQQTPQAPRQGSEKPAGESRWNVARAEYAKDALGHTRDQGILETAVGLEVSGVHVVESCEGHIDGTAAPYIDVAAKNTMDIPQLYEMLGKEETRKTAEH